ncbi:POU domain class 2-associating factor 1 [Merluccius polli]|uniref:POU domain class 2-associating factor 1 n=1 Tax=Merluccius polli TaxID=89951 RepID=A0AA47MPF3_MERPO|nr:POU domain class 2-associating factor 1 [Merluccius polli]
MWECNLTGGEQSRDDHIYRSEDVSLHHNHSPYAPGSSCGFEGDNGVQRGDATMGVSPFGEPLCGEWAIQHQGAQTPQTLHTPPAWCSVDYTQQQDPSSTLGPQSYPLSRGLAGDVYMQTLCPSYALVGPPHTLLTYTHAPLLTSLGVECPDAGLTYIPWGAPPLAAMSTMPAPAVQLATCSAALPSSTLVHMPLSCPMPIPVSHGSATVPQVEVFQETEGLEFPHPADDDPHPHPHPHHSDLDASLEQAPGPLDHLVEPEMEPLNPLEKLLEDHNKGGDEEEGKERYSNSLFLADI